jgi:hypothetical protein
MSHPNHCLLIASVPTSTSGPKGRGGARLLRPPSPADAASANPSLPVPLRVPARSVEERFAELTDAWRRATEFTSSITDMATNEAYQQIIGMGRPVLSLIFAELRREPDHWFWALKAITGEDPVAPADKGDIDKMTEVWLQWAATHNYS